MLSPLYILLYASWISHALSLHVTISQSSGADNEKCYFSNGTLPCRSIKYALEILNHSSFSEENTFVFVIQDKIFDLQNEIEISQPRKDRQVFITTHLSTSVIRCVDETLEICGFFVGSQISGKFPTSNIHLSNIEFQHFSANASAVVTMWNSVNVSFINCAFTHNKRAGINAFDSSVKLEGCLFANNTSNVRHTRTGRQLGMSVGGGVGFVFLMSSNFTVVVKDTNFTGNSAAMNDSENFIPPHLTSFAIFPKLNFLGGGLVVAFLDKAFSNRVFVQSSAFVNNDATFGGGLFHFSAIDSVGNLLQIQSTVFINNRASQGGGAFSTSVWDASSCTILVKDCVIRENWSRRGGGLNIYPMSLRDLYLVSKSTMQFQNVTFDGNSGRASAAVRLDTALPVGFPIIVRPEFINCTIKNHQATYLAYTAPFTSRRIHVKFSGNNVFTMNHGAGAIEFQEGVIYLNGTLTLRKNSGTYGGAVLFRSSQIILHPGSELNFVENVASGIGGAIMVQTREMYGFIHRYNPDCFVKYSEDSTAPSEWKAKVSFIKNSARVKGAAMYISSLVACLWYEKYPFYSFERALRWSNAFVYEGNYLQPGKHFQPSSGTKYDIATDTLYFKDEDDAQKKIELSPGEKIMMDIHGFDELSHMILTIATISQTDNHNLNQLLHVDDSVHLLSPRKEVSFPFYYRLANETQYNKLTKQTLHRFQVEDIFSTLKNRYFFNVTAIPCRPGFMFQDTICTCDKSIQGVLRCNDDSRTVYLKEGYWGGLMNGRLVTYFCPPEYCNCITDGDLPGCVFNAARVDDQCAHNRTGVLCGKCKAGLSVGLRKEECLECEDHGAWIIVFVVIVVVVICVITIILNPCMSSELRGPLFFFQVLPFIFKPNNVIGTSVISAAQLLNFGGPLIYLLHSCVVEGMTDLFAVSMGYLMPFVILMVFLISYILSSTFYLVKFKFRKNSSLQSFWLMMLFVYNYLAVTSFMLLYCPNVGGELVFFYDGNVRCFEGEHLVIALLAIFVLLVLVVPLPLIVIVLTKGYWKVDPQYVATLTNGLSLHCSWWWSVDLFRRLLLMATYAFIPIWFTKQVVMILLCALVLAIHSIFQPYKKKRVNVVETLYLYTLCVMAIVQVLEDNYIADLVCLVLLIVTTVHFSVVVIYKAVGLYQSRFRRRKQKRFARKRQGYGSIVETDFEGSIDPECIRRKIIFDIIFSKDSSSDNFQ